MTKEEIQASIKSIMFSGSVCGIEIYACLRDESGYQTKKIRATDKLLSSTKDKVAGFINCTYLADDAEFDTSENIADNKKEFYEISLIENYSLEKFVAFENKSKLTNAKKLLKAKNSPVLQMKKNDLLENLKKHSRYKTMFKFEEDHIVISSQKEAAAFIKMLNDDIVRSELTGKEYDSSSKMLLGPVGASH